MENKIWGGRFTKELNSIVKKFNSSLFFDKHLYIEDIACSKAHARMLHKQNLLSEKETHIILNALDEIQHNIKNGKYVLDEEYEDIHMLIEHLLIKKIGDVGKKLHTGRSRNDQVAVDMRIYARSKGKQIKIKLKSLIDILQKLSIKHNSHMMPGYTHLQQAQPISLGVFLDAYASMFKRDLKRLENWHELMNYSPLGAGSLAGSLLPLDRMHTAKELDFKGVINNTIDAVSDRDYLIELSSIIAITMMHLSRLSEDFIIWATTEFNFIILDDAFATGSSLMPNKKNPDVLELIRGKTGRVFGNLFSLLTILKGLPMAYNKDMQEDKEGFFDSVNTMLLSLEVITPFLQSIVFNTSVMKQASEKGFIAATRILEKLVLQGIPFRDAHNKVGAWVLEAIEQEIDFLELVRHKDASLIDFD